MKKLLELINSPDGSLSSSKLSYLIFVGVYTYYMCTRMPADTWNWFVYGALVGGVDIAKKYISARIPDSPPGSALPPATPPAA